ncbi:hypothetical protein L211DRAFT_839215 [Terfezia boudieri ATCC MYA-4762]|uniref:Uncharacterized protein n=1 Tax=Terfezia boudieri ATCC MYA-4762 TaxID=1051890 RepID=A0A3N4LIY4_9PEZI|nr:hypothetical protein L211DRAFT_839215 [Terfezia boudieri ATCC MYA-4762]
MPSTQYEARRLYTLHVFKDTGSNWANPTVYVFPLSSRSAHKFDGRSSSRRYVGAGPKGYPGNRDGLVNLYRLPSDQLSFLQQYVRKLNTEVEEQREKLVKDWKASIQQEEKEKEMKEMKRKEEQMKLLDLKRQYLKEKRQNGGTSTEKQNEGERRTRKTVTRNRGRCGNSYEYDSDATVPGIPVVHPYRGGCYPPPPPPPPPHYGLAPNPAVFETPWTIEEVELTFIPEKINLVNSGDRDSRLYSFKISELGDEIRREVKLEVATNVIAPESFSSFAVVLSRCHGVERSPDSRAAYRREYSPNRSSYSDVASQCDSEEEWAESVEKVDPPKPYLYPVGYAPMCASPPSPPFGNPATGAPVPSNVVEEFKGSEAPGEVGKDEDAFETESKAGDEGEDCGEGTVYVNIVKNAE